MYFRINVQRKKDYLNFLDIEKPAEKQVFLWRTFNLFSTQ